MKQKSLRKMKKIAMHILCSCLIINCLSGMSVIASAEEVHYDKLNRITSIEYEDGSSIQYSYDANGNITKVEKDIKEIKASKEPDSNEDDPGQNEPSNPSKEPATSAKPSIQPGDGTETGGNTEGSENGGNSSGSGNGSDTGNGGVPSSAPENTTSEKPSDTPSGPSDSAMIGVTFVSKNIKYKITKYDEDKTISVIGLKKSNKKIVIPDTVKYKGIKYKVTEIGASAFKNQKKIQKITIGKNVSKIGSKAFYSCVKLKTVIVKSKVLKSVGKNSFKKTDEKLTVKVPKDKLKTYQKLFKKKGMSNKAKIKK